jgi:hypothetical protein
LSFVHTGEGTTPYSESCPPETMMPRETPSFAAAGAPVSVIVALLTKGRAALPMLNAPPTWMLAAVSATSRSSNTSVPWMLRAPSEGVLVSRMIVRPAGTTTCAPAPGSVPPQVAGFDQRSASEGTTIGVVGVAGAAGVGPAVGAVGAIGAIDGTELGSAVGEPDSSAGASPSPHAVSASAEATARLSEMARA